MNKFFQVIIASAILYIMVQDSRETTNPIDSIIVKEINYFTQKIIKKTVVEKKIKARLTVYWAKGGGTDSDTARKKSSSGTRLREGVSVAVDPRLIPFYKRLYIPNLGIRVAHDTGTAVKQKKASAGKLPVIDIFFEKKRDAMRFAYNNPKIVTVSVYKY
jgi:3D (Asp-Asp-Asp) domain-containing protein